MTYAKVIADSISAEGVRLTTMEVRFHRFVLAEFNTHRAFSRNSASSRAIPVRKQLERVKNDPALPVSWPAEQKGMQGGEEWEDEDVVSTFEYWWLNARDHAERAATLLSASTPTFLGTKQWHTPYIEPEDVHAVISTLDLGSKMYSEAKRKISKVSAARCARVSYLTQDGKRDIQQDLDLYERLVSADPPHWSPLEHVATPWALNIDAGFNMYFYDEHNKKRKVAGHRPKVGNLLGWRSLRTELEMVPE